MTPCVEHTQYLGQHRYGNCKLHGKQFGLHVRTLILRTGEQPDGRQALHTCDNKRCINVEHLYWGTHTQNMRDAVARGRSSRGERQHLSVLTVEKVRTIRQRLAGGEYQKDIARDFGVAQSTVACINRGATWAHVGATP